MRPKCPVLLLAAAISTAIGAGFLIESAGDVTPLEVAVGFLFLATLCGLTQLILVTVEKLNRPADKAFDLGYEMGRDAGYMEGRKANRVDVVRSLNDYRTG